MLFALNSNLLTQLLNDRRTVRELEAAAQSDRRAERDWLCREAEEIAAEIIERLRLMAQVDEAVADSILDRETTFDDAIVGQVYQAAAYITDLRERTIRLVDRLRSDGMTVRVDPELQTLPSTVARIDAATTEVIDAIQLIGLPPQDDAEMREFNLKHFGVPC